MKRSRDEYIMSVFPNELLYEIIGTDVKVFGKLAQTSKVMREWMDEQADLYFRLFKYNFKNHYCLLHELTVHRKDLETALNINNTPYHNENEGELIEELFFSLHVNYDKQPRWLGVDFIMRNSLTDLMQCTGLVFDDLAHDMMDEIHEEWCDPNNPLIIERCEKDKSFAVKMSRLYNQVIHPYGYPHASYYMKGQHDTRHMICRILRTLSLFITEMSDEEFSDSDSDIQLLRVDEGMALMYRNFIHYICVLGGYTDKFDLTGLRELFELTETEDEEVYGKWDEDNEENTHIVDNDAKINIFIRKLDALTLEKLPPKKDVNLIYQYWLDHIVPYIKEFSIKDPTHMPDGWEIEKTDTYAKQDECDTLYFDTIDDKRFKKKVRSIFMKHEIIGLSPLPVERSMLLSYYKKDFEKDIYAIRLDQKCFHLFLYRFLNGPDTNDEESTTSD